MSALYSVASTTAVTSLFAIACIAIGCSSVGAPKKTTVDATANRPGDDDDPNDDASADDAPVATSKGPFGVVAIDVQKVFFTTATSHNPGANVGERMNRTERLFKLAGEHDVPIFVTYEDSKSGDHGLPPSLAAALPSNAKEFIKTTFGAMGRSR